MFDYSFEYVTLDEIIYISAYMWTYMNPWVCGALMGPENKLPLIRKESA